MNQKIAFMGTPDFAVPSLKVLANRTLPDNLLIVTQPDRPAGRGRNMQAPPVKRAADELQLRTIQLSTFKDAEARAQLETFAPDLIVVAAFGLILPKWVLSLPDRGCINVHASNLPRFRGASPVAAAIEMGDVFTAVALMEMERGLDTGRVYARERVEIRTDDTTESLTATLAESGAQLLDARLAELLAGEMSPVPQSGRILETRKIVKDHGVIHWTAPANVIERHVRAMWPWPRAWTVGQDNVRVQIHAAEVAEHASEMEPGTVVGHDGGMVVAAGAGSLRLLTVQLPGKRAHSVAELAQHPAFAIGARFGCGEDFVAPEPWIVETGAV